MRDFVRVALPGERAWAEVLETIDEDTVKARVDNRVYTPAHGYSLNDVIIAVRDDDAWLVLSKVP